MVSLVLTGVSGTQIGGLSQRDATSYERIRPSVVTLLRGNLQTGMAALIDASGLFVAHQTSVDGSTVNARLYTGRTIRLQVVGKDNSSQLVVLKSIDWTPQGIRPVDAPASITPNSPIFAVLPQGPIRAEYVQGSKLGVLRSSRRAVPLSEIRFEAPVQFVAGALVFTMSGDFMGALSATLARRDDDVYAQMRNMMNSINNGGIRGGAVPQQAFGQNAYQGPAPLTVAYTPGPAVLHRILEGFRSPDHVVEHPTLGVLILDTPGGGALVQQVVAGSSAEKAGLRPGDIILSIGPDLIRNQVDYANVLFRLDPGAKITLRIKRGNTEVIQDIIVGKSRE